MMLGVAGCQTNRNAAHESTTPTFPNWPKVLSDFRFRWSAEPGIDLVSGPAVPLRAYLESYRVAEFTLDVNATYPGFQRAVPPGPSDSVAYDRAPWQLRDIRPRADPNLAFGPPGRFYGNEYFHVLDLSAIDTGYRAYVCDGFNKVFRDGGGDYRPHIGESEGKYVPVVGHSVNPSVLVWRVEFSNHPPNPGAPAPITVAQKGPNPAPVGDVFGPWHITGASTRFWGDVHHSKEMTQQQEECYARLPHDYGQRQAFEPGPRGTPPPADPAIPGWPAGRADTS